MLQKYNMLDTGVVQNNFGSLFCALEHKYICTMQVLYSSSHNYARLHG
jgi:hypothetical protein